MLKISKAMIVFFALVQQNKTHLIKMSTKEYDLIVFGATSFTGKLVVEYLNEKYPDLSWAIAARNQEKIDAVKSELSCDVPSLILDSMNMDDIEKAIKRKKQLTSRQTRLDFQTSVAETKKERLRSQEVNS